MKFLPVQTPEFNKPVRAIVKSSCSQHVSFCNLKAVDESDCTWRFFDAGSELSNNWDVVYWEYLETKAIQDNL